MNPVVTVVDYGMGNLLSVIRALEHCGARVAVESSPSSISKAGLLILPGVGAFNDGMAELEQRNLIETIRSHAASGRPLLGICLGMQILFDGSDEFGARAGLGLIPGWVKKLPVQPGNKLPHIGWNAIRPPTGRNWSNTPLKQMTPGKELYFAHSFHAVPQHSCDCLAQTLYGDFPFCSLVQNGGITGCQFHPEKSGPVGLQLISAICNFHHTTATD